MTDGDLRAWLLRIADSLEQWPATTNRNVDRAFVVELPADAVVRIVATEVGNELQRTAILEALPRLATGDYPEATQLIRAVAASFC